ncbi:MAG: hypothetical protein J0H69_19505 [Burkholderiales bacterium]|nr:hypothetical protein [Burkholderiales bacterium]
MSITLTYNGTTATLPEDLLWANEFQWEPVQQSREYSSTGALIIDEGLKQAGRPVHLSAGEDFGWISRAMCETLSAWSRLPGISLELQIRGEVLTVAWDREDVAFEAEPLIHYADPSIDSTDQYVPTLRFITL